ncbi:DNA mismatch repair protein [Gnomoniopsis sp. IMI 355080]|nr:DNA mismatch repair protein [Gnomoniopsis sp. IMI 355080]
MSIKPLPGDVVAQIKSSVTISSLNSVVTGLIANSLDAEATKINISVDYSRGNCSIEDNGIGIPPSEFKEDGALGQLHCTSKFPAHPTIHGKHGVFLASVASLSLLSITSHHQDYHSHNSMSIHNSRVLARNTPCLPEQKLLTFTHGTRVTVRDLFGSMPVRVKHRALQAEKSSFTRDWDRLALDVVALLIPWPAAVSLSIRDTASRQSLSLKIGAERCKWVNDSCRLLYQASLCDSPTASDWIPVGASSPTLSLSGFVCREPVATKRAQFISLDIKPLSNEFRCNVLYEEVNKVFADSSFGLLDDESDEDEMHRKTVTDDFTQKERKAKKGVDRWPMFFLKMTPTASSLDVDDILDDRQPNLTVIIDLLKAMFFEFLKRNHCRPRQVLLSTKSKSRSEQQQQHANSYRSDGLASSASSRDKPFNTGSGLPLVSTSAPDMPGLDVPVDRPSSPFAPLSKIKSGKSLRIAPSRSRTQSGPTTPAQRSRHSTPGGLTDTSRASTPAEPFRPSLFDANGKLTRKPFDDIDPREVLSRSNTRDPGPALLPPDRPTTSSGTPSQDGLMGRINPSARMETTINSRTDFVVAPKPLTLNRRLAEQKLKEGSQGEERHVESRTTSWVTDLIGKWKNPVFELTEPPIPKLPDVVETLGLEPRPAGHHCNDGSATFTMGTRHETSALCLQGRLSKDTLKKAQVIAQVDKKFIFARLPFDRISGDKEDSPEPLDPSSVLLLIDQHAADERCRVEELMTGYFKPSIDENGDCVWKAATEVLSKPVQFELSGQEINLLHEFQPYFAYWGVCYNVEAAASADKRKTSRSTKCEISVRSLPPAILERCRTDPRLLAELIRKEAWRLKDEHKVAQPLIPTPVSPEDIEGAVPSWVSLFHACPPGIVDLINSRSCRSAIMFNDTLTLDECVNLLARKPGQERSD